MEREDPEKGWRNENPHPSVHPSIRQSIHSVILLFIRPLLGAHSVSGTALIAQRTKTAKIRFLLSSKAHHRRKPCWCPVCQQAPRDSAQRPGSRGRWSESSALWVGLWLSLLLLSPKTQAVPRDGGSLSLIQGGACLALRGTVFPASYHQTLDSSSLSSTENCFMLWHSEVSADRDKLCFHIFVYKINDLQLQ